MAMTPDEERITRIEEELDGARRDLHETLSTVEAKVEQQVERAEDAFNPQKLLRENLVGAACVAGVLGFVVGSSKYRKVAGPALLVALGYAIWSGLANPRSDGDGGESASS
jgi:hypothetical protein